MWIDDSLGLQDEHYDDNIVKGFIVIEGIFPSIM